MGAGTTIVSAESLKSGQLQPVCDSCKPGTSVVNADAVYGLHLADALSIDPESNRKVPETCAFIGRVTELPGSADSSFERFIEGDAASPAMDVNQVQQLWTEGATWALQAMSESSST